MYYPGRTSGEICSRKAYFGVFANLNFHTILPPTSSFSSSAEPRVHSM